MSKKFLERFELSSKEGKYITPQSIRVLMREGSPEEQIIGAYLDFFLEKEWSSRGMKWHRFTRRMEAKRLRTEARLVGGWSTLRYKTGRGLRGISRWFSRRADQVMRTNPSDRE